jgi:Arc/MetJ-type ribon-helix-helix transcriptional regulator
MSVITVRTDPEVDEALAALTADGSSRSHAVRLAILEAARARRRADLEAESRALATDPEDLAEARAVQADMEALRAW